MPTPKENIITAFEASGTGYGDFVSHKDLMHWAGLQLPNIRDLRSQDQLEDEMKRYALARLTAIEGLKQHLLAERKMLLQPVRGEGYRVVLPKEQTDIAITHGMRTVRKGLQQAEKGLNAINTAMLTSEERAYSNSVSSRLGGLKLMLGRKRDLLTNG
jgi:hypothetical protein